MTEDYQGCTRDQTHRDPPHPNDKILRDVFHDPQTVHKYAKHLDKKVQVDSSASPEPEINSDLESMEDSQC